MNEERPKNQFQKSGTSKPGTLSSAVTLKIKTALAQRLIEGRRPAEGVSEIMGVNNFGFRVQQVWIAACNDDPYADWVLLRIEKSIETAKQMISEEKNRIEGILKSMGDLKIETANAKPVSIEFRFANPYGYMAAYLVGEYDQLLLLVMIARHLALIDRDQCEQIIRATGKKIRRALSYAVLWRYTGVTREDLRQNNQNAGRAAALMGDLPENILSMEERARMAPTIKPIHDQNRLESDMNSGDTEKATG